MLEWIPLTCERCGRIESEEEEWDTALCPACTSTSRTCSKCGEPESGENPFAKRGQICRLCINEYHTAWRMENKDKVKVRNERYRERHPYKGKKLSKEARLRRNAQRRAHYHNMTDEQREAHRKYSREWRRRARQKKREA